MQTKIDKPTNLFVIISMLYCSSLVFSNVIAGKMVALFGTVLPAAVIVFPLVYIISDIMTEIYGYKLSMRVILTNTVIQIMMALVFMLTVALPHPVFFGNQEAYATVLGQVPRTVIASIIAYLVGDWLNTLVLSKMKVWTKGRCFFLRALGSTVVGQFFDAGYRDWETDRKSTRLNSSHSAKSRMPSSA